MGKISLITSHLSQETQLKFGFFTHHVFVPFGFKHQIDCGCVHSLHPRWSVDFGLEWAKHSRLKRVEGKEPPYQGEDKEGLVLYAKDYLKGHPEINFFIFGHRHIELDLMLARESRIIILGDWINCFSYAVYDGEHIFLEQFIEGVTEP